ncbi:MAG: hypothetical protein F9K40_14375 [Kofleriaceae bacterium]|nr:MAG: hypothetical protein F9K40_14375 [Kofleriaceae bacterium]MBZ0239014.1 hypothetical protein [Kofleriaceae bacterium]
MPRPDVVHAMMNMSQEVRTTVHVQCYQDPFPLVGGWAAHHKFKEVAPPDDGLWVFNRGWNGAQFVAFLLQPPWLTVQASIRFSFGDRLRSFFILPDEMHIRSGGARGVLARSQLRGDVNDLLMRLGAQPVP